MPMYPFRCVSCNYTETELYGINEHKPVVCPKCGRSTLRQEIGMPVDWNPHPCTFNGKFPLSPGQKEQVRKHGPLPIDPQSSELFA